MPQAVNYPASGFQLIPKLCLMAAEGCRLDIQCTTDTMPPRFLDPEKVRRLAARALYDGARPTGIISGEWDISGSCENPKLVTLAGRPSAQAASVREPYQRVVPDGYGGEVVKTFYDSRIVQSKYVHIGTYGADVIYAETGKPVRTPHSYYLDVWTRCRKCAKCLAYRSWVWRNRATVECHSATRTWFATLTLSPANHVRYGFQAGLKVAKRRGDDFDALPESEQFALRNQEISKEITKWLKRVRKYSGAPFKYLLVTEAHKSGLPHYHLLIHEQCAERPLRHAMLSDQWRLGFSKFKLVDDPKAATYVTKYLSKSAIARVRASLRYGQTP